MQRAQSRQNNSQEEQQSWRTYNPCLNNQFKAVVIKTVKYRHKDTQIDLWSRTESPVINPQIWRADFFLQ